MANIGFNTEPYYDDYNEDKKFYRILYRPGYAVQARELNQMQSILQNQISRFGSHVFKEGAMVIAGESSIDTTVSYVKLESSYGGILADSLMASLVGQTITNGTLTAQVIWYSNSTSTDPSTLFVRYTNSDSSSGTSTKVFTEADVLTNADNTAQVLVAATSATGMGSIASIKRGVYFIKNNFVLVTDQTIVLDKYTDTPSYRIGLVATESEITAEEDGTLFDNAQASFNYAAPGAHRYSIDLTLTALPALDAALTFTTKTSYYAGQLVKNGNYYYSVVTAGISSIGTAPTHTSGTASNGTVEFKYIQTYDPAADTTSDTDFIELIRTFAGQTQKHVTTTAYSVLEQTLARRTYDESGNYTVRPFNIDVREHRNNNRGSFAVGTAYLLGDIVTSGGHTYVAKNSGVAGSTTPVHLVGSVTDGTVVWEYNASPYYNRGVYTPEQGGDESKLAVGLEPGKAYVQGYEIEKIGTEFINVDKARDFVSVSNDVISTTMGNYVVIQNVNNMPDIANFGTINLYSYVNSSVGVAPSGLIGTARVRGMQYDAGSGGGAIGTQTAHYKLFLFDVKLNSTQPFAEIVKSFWAQGTSNDANLNFSADITPILELQRGSVTSYTSNTYGTQGSGVYIQGTGTNFTADLQVGDYVQIGGTTTRVVSIDGTYTTTRMVVSDAVNVVGVQYSEVLTALQETQNTPLVFPLPNFAIKDISDIEYTAVQYNRLQLGSSDSDGTGYTAQTWTITGAQFASTDLAENYIVIDDDAGAGGAVIAATVTGGGTATLKIRTTNTYAGRYIKVLAAVKKNSSSALTQRTKELKTLVGATGTGGTGAALFNTTLGLNTQAVAAASSIALGKADGYKLISVKMAPTKAFGATGIAYADYTVDITDRYDFDDGQRPTHYDLARISLKPSYAPPTAPILVEFSYFTHGPGDFFTVKSYPYPTYLDYRAIPMFNGQPLRDYIDFRPRIDDNGTTFTSGTGVNLLPMRGQDLVCDYSYYLARKSKIAIDFSGKFFAIDGVSSLNPGDAEDPALGMVLYNLALEPYTFSTTQNSVSVTKIDNKRYTMRDIGKLEKRIDNLEYYTSLSLLEQQTESLKVTDSAGNDRFKNGFFVDGFAGHDSGDTTNQDYLCSVDMERQELRPFYTMQNINMIEKLVDDASRNGAGYKLYGDVITLPVLSTPPLITQSYASRLENINPFAVFTFIGDVKLNPSSDDWFETDRRPDVIVNVEGNYNTIKNLAEKAGVLGTVWNAWQTQWTGQPYSTGVKTYVGDKRGLGVVGWRDGTVSETDAATLDQMFGNGPANSGWAHRVVQAETLAVNIGQSRTGVTSSIVTTIDKQVVADRVLSTAAIPYMRSRNILIQTQKLKPSTRFYPFFDGVDISAYCTPATKLVYTQPSGYTGTFDAFVNVGANSTMKQRQINGDTQVCLTRGDVIYTSIRSGTPYTIDSSPATAVVVGAAYNYTTGEYALDIVNIIGSFSANDKIVGSNSGATALVNAAPTVKAIGSSLITNAQGELNLLFNIPNTEALRFRTGSRELKLVDTTTVDGDFTSRGRANYRAEGVLETKQQTVNAVRNAYIAEEPAYGNQVIVGDAGSRVVSDTGWYDPLAQTFLVQSSGGAFLSGVDIFFATKDPSIPVTIEIREVVNGFPGKRVLPFSRKTIKPAEVNAPIAGTTIDTNVFNTVLLNDVTVAKYDAPTRFNFDSPVYVQDNTEYAIVLASDSNNYKVWISQLGDTIPGSSRTISEQPYAGVLFKSQNASTWTADQTQDLKFTIYRCQFDTQAVSDVQFINDVVPLQTLDTDPFEVRSGVTTVRVWQKDHGFTPTSTVTISGVAASVAGIPAAELNGKHAISNLDLDSYTITVTTSPTSTTYGGGTSVKATRNVQFDYAQPSVAVQAFTETAVDYSLKTIAGQSVDNASNGGSQVAYVQDSSPVGILINDTNYFSTPRMVASSINEADLISGSDKKSLTMHVAMSTTNDRLSPVIDTHRTSFIAVSNKVNAPTETNMNVANLDYTPIVSANTTIGFSGSTLTCSDSTTKAKLAALTVGKYLTIAGSTSGLNDGTFLISAVASDGATVTVTGKTFTTQSSGTAITLNQREMFVAEIAPHGGSSYSAYVTKKVNLANPSSYLRVMFSVNLPKEASIEVYYKANPAGAATGFDQINHTLMTPDKVIPNYTNSDNKFVDVTYSLAGMATYDAILVKIVMKSINSSAIPRIKDLRVVSCA